MGVCEEMGKRTRGGWACPWGRLDVKVEVDERVELLEREGLQLLVVDEHTLPFLRGPLVALEYYHLVVLERNSHQGVYPCAMGLWAKWARHER